MYLKNGGGLAMTISLGFRYKNTLKSLLTKTKPYNEKQETVYTKYIANVDAYTLKR